MIRAVIVDDEKHCRDSLEWQLKTYCPDVEIVARCENANAAIQAIAQAQPRLLFLDVEMPGMSGFDLLAQIPEIRFDIIFTTGFDQYAIRAIRFGALDYLLKPVDKDDLIQAIKKIQDRSGTDILKQLTATLTQLKQSSDLSFQKIALPMLHGYELVPVSNIRYCESNDNYTNVYITDGRNLLISKTLKDIQDLLDMPPFFRVHHSFLVNLRHAVRYVKGEGGQLIMSNEQTIPVSRARKEELLKLITHLSV